MEKYKVDFEYMMIGSVEVEANSEAEAIAIVENKEISKELKGNYLADSFNAIVNDEVIVSSKKYKDVPFGLLKQINQGVQKDEITNEQVLKFIDEYRNHSSDFHLYRSNNYTEIETWTDGGVNMFMCFHHEDKLSFFNTLVDYVESFDIEEEINIHRESSQYRNDFTLQESLDDFNAYRDKLSDLLMYVFINSIRPSVVNWLEVNRDHGFFENVPEGKKESYDNITDEEVEYYFFEWMWNERD